MQDSLLPPQPAADGDERVSSEDAKCVRDGLHVLVAEFDHLEAPHALLKRELGRLEQAGTDEVLRVLRGLLAVSSMLVQSLALEQGSRTETALQELALDVERLYPADSD
jgi:hypothetical protein